MNDMDKMGAGDRIAVLIPCYNEEKTVGKVVADWKKVFPTASIYVYDNASTDNTSGAAESAGAIVRESFMRGKGRVVRQMFREIQADCYLMVDGDDTYDASRGPAMARAVLSRGADMVVGNRLVSGYMTENKRPFHCFGNLFMKSCIRILFHTDIEDVMTGCRAFSRRFVKTFPAQSHGFEVETEMSVHAACHDFHVMTVDVPYRDRPEGSVSKLRTVRDGIRVTWAALWHFMIYRPMLFFGGAAAALGIVAAVPFMSVFLEYLETGCVPRFPTMILSGFTAMAGLLSFFTGVVLQVLRFREKQLLEWRLMDICGHDDCYLKNKGGQA